MLIPVLLLMHCSQPVNNNSTLKYTASQFVESKLISGGSFSPDGSKILYTTNETGMPAAWVYDIKSKESQLIHQDSIDPVYSLCLFDEDDKLVFTSNHNGSQYIHIYVKDGDQVRSITPGDKIRARWRGVKEDFSGIYYTSNAVSPRQFDLYEYDFEKQQSQLVFQNETGYSLSYISSDHRYILLHELISEEVTNLHLYDIREDKMVNLSEANESSIYYGQGFSSDNGEVYYLTNRDNEYNYIEKYDIQTGERTPMVKKEWDIVGITFSDDHSMMAIYSNENGRARVELQNVKTSKVIDVPFLKNAEIERVRFSPNNQHLLLQVAGYNHPKDLWVLDVSTGSYEIISEGLNSEIDKADLVEPQDVLYESFDGLKIPAFLYQPKETEWKKSAALIWTHGGPGGQFRSNYNQDIQYLVNQGYTVLAVNNRGSSGYGKTFKSLDNQKHGVDDLKDILKGKEYLLSLGGIDEDKVGIIGDSYGGYLVLAALTFYPEEFAIGVDQFGISNWLHVLNSIPIFWETRRAALYEEMGHPQKDSVMLYEKSPLFFSDQIQSPLMVIQGANDSKVPQSESDSLVARLRTQDVPVEYLLFDDEGHGIRKRENQIKSLEAIVLFLETYLN